MYLRKDDNMISYEPFWNLLEKLSETQYSLIHNYGFSGSTIYRLKHNKPISTETINKLCFALNCQPGDIMCYISDSPEKMSTMMNLSHNTYKEKEKQHQSYKTNNKND